MDRPPSGRLNYVRCFPIGNQFIQLTFDIKLVVGFNADAYRSVLGGG